MGIPDVGLRPAPDACRLLLSLSCPDLLLPTSPRTSQGRTAMAMRPLPRSLLDLAYLIAMSLAKANSADVGRKRASSLPRARLRPFGADVSEDAPLRRAIPLRLPRWHDHLVLPRAGPDPPTPDICIILHNCDMTSCDVPRELDSRAIL